MNRLTTAVAKVKMAVAMATQFTMTRVELRGMKRR